MRKAWKGLLLAAALLSLLEGVYFVTANWALRSGALARLLSRKPERLQVEWTSGRTLWPGIVHLEGLRVRGQSERLQTYARLDRCTLRLHLPFLLIARVHVYQAQGDGVALWIRHRREPGKPSPSDRFEPPIPGLAQDAPAPRRKLGPSPVVLHFNGVRLSDVREIWIGPYRTRGEGTLGGSATYRLRGALKARGVELALQGAQVEMGDYPVASGLTARWQLDVDSVVPRKARGRAFLRHLSGRLTTRGDVSSLGFLNEAFGGPAPVTFGGRGRLVSDVLLDGGVVEPGSTVSWEGEELSVSASGFTARGRGRFTAGAGAADREALGLSARFTDITLSKEGVPPVPVRGPGLTVALEGPRLDLAAGGEEMTVTLDLPGSEVQDLSALNAFITPKANLSFLEGSAARLSAHLEDRSGHCAGSLAVEGRDVGVRVGARNLRGSFDLALAVKDGDLRTGLLDVSGSRVSFEDARAAASGGQPGAPWNASAEFTDAALSLSVPLGLQADASVRLDHTAPVVALFTSRMKSGEWLEPLLDFHQVVGMGRVALDKNTAVLTDVSFSGRGAGGSPAGFTVRAEGSNLNLSGGLESLKMRLTVEEWAVPDLSVFNSYLPASAGVVFTPGGRGRAGADVTIEGGEGRGHLALTGSGVGFRVQDTALAGDLDFRLEIEGGDGSGRFQRARSQLSLKNVSLKDRKGEREGWWADLKLANGSFLWGRPLSLSGDLTLRMRDTRPIVALFAAKSRVVGWFENQLDVPDIAGTARLGVEGPTTVLDRVDVMGKDLQLLARLRLQGKRKDGALYAQLRGLSCGVQLRDEKRSWKLIGARKWYDSLPNYSR